jgi:hypothetical protein
MRSLLINYLENDDLVRTARPPANFPVGYEQSLPHWLGSVDPVAWPKPKDYVPTHNRPQDRHPRLSAEIASAVGQLYIHHGQRFLQLLDRIGSLAGPSLRQTAQQMNREPGMMKFFRIIGQAFSGWDAK